MKNQVTDLLAGAGKLDITPTFPVGLGGYRAPENRIFKEIRDRLYLTCTAVREGETTLLIFTADTQNWGLAMVEEARQQISAATGVPENNMFFGATHTHTAPAMRSEAESSQQYKAFFLAAAVKAAETALADLAPAKASYGSMQVENMNFVRHYVHNDGRFSGSNFNEELPKDTITGHTTEADKQLILVKFAREGKPDILLVNWQAHPDVVPEVKFKVVSGGQPVYMVSQLEEKTGMIVSYFSGAEGNLNPCSWIEAEDPGLLMDAYGKKMAEYALQVLENMTPVEGTAIRAARKPVTIAINHGWDHMLAEAREIRAIHETEGRDTATAAGLKYNFSSAYHANAILARVNMPQSDETEVGAFAIGNLGFISGTYEMFCENGMFVKEHSPFPTTFVITGNWQYIPSKGAHDYRCYEADCGPYARGVAEQLADEFVSLLNDLK